jgi:hypothetical protein
MIIKILSSAKNFAGIHYSERKNDMGKSKLLKAVNFGGLGHQNDLTKSDYINYMKAVCALNPRVKNKQFHAVISVKGSEYTPDQLADIGVKYLECMGYGKNPYLIYHHSDTENTHIHLVSSRVDKSGKKIDDTFEKIRSQKVLQEILLQDPKYEAETSIAESLKYHFSTQAQFRLLLELRGFHLREKNDQAGVGVKALEVIKYGRVQSSIDLNLIDQRICAFKLPDQRAKQLQALLHKYAVGLPEEKLAAVMKDKFGLSIVFHRKSGHDKAYGYSVVDHVSKTVFKGSQLMRLGELFAAKQDENVLHLVNELSQKPGCSFEDLQSELAKLGLHLKQNGGINLPSGTVKLPLDLINSLRYYDRVQLAGRFQINDASCKLLLGKLFNIRPEHIYAVVSSGNRFAAHKALIAYLDQSKKWETGLQHFNYKLLQSDKNIFLFSPSESLLLRPDILLGKGMDYPPGLAQSLPDLSDAKQEQLFRETSKENILDLLLAILSESQRSAPDNKNKKRRSLKL